MGKKISAKTITLKDMWDVFLQRLWIILLVAVIAGAGSFTVDRLTFDPQYSSTATMYILRDNKEEVDANDADTAFSLALKVVNDCTYLLKSRTVVDEVEKQLDLDIPYDELNESISTYNPEETRILEVTVTADTPEGARDIVNAVCTVGETKINDAMGYDQVKMYESGIVDEEPCNKTGLINFVLLALVAAVLVYVIFLLVYMIDDCIRTEEDIERYLGLSMLGDIPDADNQKKRSYGYHHGRYSYGYGYGYGKRHHNEQADSEED